MIAFIAKLRVVDTPGETSDLGEVIKRIHSTCIFAGDVRAASLAHDSENMDHQERLLQHLSSGLRRDPHSRLSQEETSIRLSEKGKEKRTAYIRIDIVVADTSEEVLATTTTAERELKYIIYVVEDRFGEMSDVTKSLKRYSEFRRGIFEEGFKDPAPK